MLWWPKRVEKGAPVALDDIAPTQLPVELDSVLFKLHFGRLLETTALDGGIEGYLGALGAKQRGFAAALAGERSERLTLSGIEALLDRVFTARRRIFSAIEALGEARVGALIENLVQGADSLAPRMQAFVDAMPGATGTDRESIKAAAKLRRAAWDFAAELVHFADPVRYPLMTRWVWDRTTQSGALREFVRGGDALLEISFTNEPAQFEAGRGWLAECIAGEGIYRDVPLWIDLTLAQAYTTYVRSMTDGSLGADFGRGAPAHEQLKKLLGIDVARANGRTRVRK